MREWNGTPDDEMPCAPSVDVVWVDEVDGVAMVDAPELASFEVEESPSLARCNRCRFRDVLNSHKLCIICSQIEANHKEDLR
jgi:hypothetical protein